MNRSTSLGRIALSALLLAASPTMAADVGPMEHVDALNKVFGEHRGTRAIHAKGTVLEGDFRAERFGFIDQQSGASSA